MNPIASAQDESLQAVTPVEDADDHTVMVDRAAPGDGADEDADDHTVMVDRAAPGDGADEDHTVVVGRSSTAKPATSNPAAPAVRSTRRRGLTPPPVPAGFAPQAVEAAGADAKEHYRPRDIPAPPEQAPVIAEGPASTREASATMPSVARHARVTARVAVVVFAASCVASVVGLTLVALAVFSARH